VRVDVRLHDPLVAKEHFEICWDEHLRVHTVRNLGARYQPSANGDPIGLERRPLSVGDVITIGNWTLEYVGVTAG